MPNHCQNTVLFKGTAEQINTFLEAWGAKTIEEAEEVCPLYATVPYPLAAELAYFKDVVNKHWINETDEEVKTIEEAIPYYMDSAKAYLEKGSRLQKHLGKDEITLKDLFTYVKSSKVPPPYSANTLPGRIAWGSKWGYYDTQVSWVKNTAKSCVYLSGTSAWGPP